jgi:PPE-repeat protein
MPAGMPLLAVALAAPVGQEAAGGGLVPEGAAALVGPAGLGPVGTAPVVLPFDWVDCVGQQSSPKLT